MLESPLHIFPPFRRLTPDISSPLVVSPKDVFPVLDTGEVSIDDDSDSDLESWTTDGAPRPCMRA